MPTIVLSTTTSSDDVVGATVVDNITSGQHHSLTISDVVSDTEVSTIRFIIAVGLVTVNFTVKRPEIVFSSKGPLVSLNSKQPYIEFESTRP